MKLFDIVTNALELCDSRIETACEYQALSMYWRYVDRQKKNPRLVSAKTNQK